MNKRLIPVVIVAIVVAGIFTLLFYKMMSNRLSAEAPKPVATTKILVAARNLELGTLIKEGDITVADWPGTVPPQAILATKLKDEKDGPLDRGVIAPIYQGEPILPARLAPKGAGGGLASLIEPGKRAIAVRVNEASSVSGFVVPGMRVDILIAGMAPGMDNTQGTIAKTLLQNVTVLSAGQNTQRDAEGKPISVPVVNLLVTPEQAEILSLAGNDTRLQLTLRNPVDQETAKTPGTALRRLFTGLKPEASAEKAQAPKVVRVRSIAPPAPKEKPPVEIEIMQGGTKVKTTFKAEPED